MNTTPSPVDLFLRLIADPNVQNLIILGVGSLAAALLGKKANKARKKKKARNEAIAKGDLPLLAKEE